MSIISTFIKQTEYGRLAIFAGLSLLLHLMITLYFFYSHPQLNHQVLKMHPQQLTVRFSLFGKTSPGKPQASLKQHQPSTSPAAASQASHEPVSAKEFTIDREALQQAVSNEGKRLRLSELFRQQVNSNITYPLQAKNRSLTGNVTIAYEINTNGLIENIDVVESSGHQILDRAALKSIRATSPFLAARSLENKLASSITLEFVL